MIGLRNRLLRRYVHGPGADEPLVQYDGAGLTSKKWLHADARGSIITLSDATGAVVAKNTYDEYGAPGAGNTGLFQYTGQMWLAEAGLYHYKARSYHPALGRFLQTDPIGFAGGMNFYAYVGNDPVNGTDPSGLCTGSRIVKGDGSGQCAGGRYVAGSGGCIGNGCGAAAGKPSSIVTGDPCKICNTIAEQVDKNLLAAIRAELYLLRNLRGAGGGFGGGSLASFGGSGAGKINNFDFSPNLKGLIFVSLHDSATSNSLNVEVSRSDGSITGLHEAARANPSWMIRRVGGDGDFWDEYALLSRLAAGGAGAACFKTRNPYACGGSVVLGVVGGILDYIDGNNSQPAPPPLPSLHQTPAQPANPL